jgi:hypothetical protein
VPDAPVSRFDLKIAGGKRGILVAPPASASGEGRAAARPRPDLQFFQRVI